MRGKEGEKESGKERKGLFIPLVLLLDVIFFTHIDKVNHGLGCEHLQIVHVLNLFNINPFAPCVTPLCVAGRGYSGYGMLRSCGRCAVLRTLCVCCEHALCGVACASRYL